MNQGSLTQTEYQTAELVSHTDYIQTDRSREIQSSPELPGIYSTALLLKIPSMSRRQLAIVLPCQTGNGGNTGNTPARQETGGDTKQLTKCGFLTLSLGYDLLNHETEIPQLTR